MIKYTIIMPMFNSQKYLSKNIEFFKKNSRLDVEFLIINDGSTDNSYNTIKKANIKNITLLSQKNHGVSYSRNVGIKEAKGKYICFLDSDDYYEENILNFFDSVYEKDYDVIRFGYYIELKGKKISGKFVNENKEINNFRKNIENYRYLYTTCFFNNPVNQLIKKEILIKNSIYFNEEYKYGEDLEFNRRLMHNVDSVLFSNLKLYNYRINYMSTTNNQELNNVKKCINDAINVHVDGFKKCKEEYPIFLNECYKNVSLELTTVLRRLFFVKRLSIFKIKKILNDIKRKEKMCYIIEYSKKYENSFFFKKIILKDIKFFWLLWFKVYFKTKRFVSNIIKFM